MKGWIFGFLIFSSCAKAWTLLSPGVVGWPGPSVTVHVNVAQCPLAESVITGLVDRALAVWNGVSTSSLSVVRASALSSVTAEDYLAGSTVDVPLIVCDPNFEQDIGSSDEVPAATYTDSTGSAISSAAIFLNAEPGALAAVDALDQSELRIVVAHEMGHVLGLGHTKVESSLMYYSISGKADARLSEDDMMGVSYLYPRNEFSRGTFGCAASQAPSAPGYGSLGFAICILFVLIYGRARIRMNPAKPEPPL